jgi:hypothetical protein
MVEPETFTFLADLAINNRKVWMDEHRAERDDALRNFTGIAMTLHDYADRFDPFVAQAKIKPKQSYTKFFQEPRERVGREFYRADVDVLPLPVILQKTLAITSTLSQAIATQVPHCSNHPKRPLRGYAIVLSMTLMV